MRPLLFLFDVDGTLVDAAGAGRRAIEAALEVHLGPKVRREEAWLSHLRLDGMTDRLIIREAFLAVGHAFEDALCDAILKTYVGLLEREIVDGRYRVLPGVEKLLAALRASGASFGLCTGNVPEGARIKLARGGLDRYFDFGGEGSMSGFGSDGEARELIVEAALRRASARLGREVSARDVLVVGDTPRDILAARMTGCRVLAVATGRFSLEALRAEGADHAVANLAEEEAWHLVLGGNGGSP